MDKFVNKQLDGDNKNKDDKGLEFYLDITRTYKSPFDPFVITTTKEGFNIIDESVHEVGAKARMADYYISNIQEEELVYVAPRNGFAAISLSYLASKHGKRLTLVMPSSKEISDHQALSIQYGAKPLFVRIAAMPNANNIAAKYANAVGAKFIPFGLDTELVYAGAIRSFYDGLTKYNIHRLWSVISTGVLSRSLQIALPKTKVINVAVARNIQHGELGRAEFLSYHKGFTQKSDSFPTEFNSENCYDAKGWDYMKEYGQPGDWFFNVAGNAPLPTLDKSTIDSYRDWRDYKDFPQL